MQQRQHSLVARRAAWLAMACGVLICSALDGATPALTADRLAGSSARMIVIAVADKPALALAAGSTPHGYDGLRNYAGSDSAKALTASLAGDYRLREVSAWTIDPLRLRCVLFEIAPRADRAATLQQLMQDRRVRLAQPLQDFDTFGTPNAGVDRAPSVQASAYNDPYIALQSGFSAIDAAGAQRWTQGDGVRIALVDTGLDANHPDLAGRVITQRDFLPDPTTAAATDRHGTEVAGVIVALANNGIGIAGVAPAAKLMSYRACWAVQADADAARCNSYTLALALGAAIASGARIINLSLGGPPDPLLQQLTEYALKQGAIVVAALPPSGRADGFPVDINGVIAVAAAGDTNADARALAAPGTDILTLVPGGHYDYASGSSLATGHVTGAIALLLGIDPRLHADALYSLLKKTQRSHNASIDVCAAALTLRQARGLAQRDAHCSR
ncbi:MAG: S8 family serine peptidase [Dokdonella sp.]